MMMPPRNLSTDWKLIMLRARDDVALADYTAFERKMEEAVLAAISGGKTVDEAKAVAEELYAEAKASAWSRAQATGEKLYEYRRAKAEEAMKEPPRPWWKFWP